MRSFTGLILLAAVRVNLSRQDVLGSRQAQFFECLAGYLNNCMQSSLRSLICSILLLQIPMSASLLSGCANTPSKIRAEPRSGLPAVSQYALSLVGTPYRYGQSSRSEGFDCSGFVHHVYARQGIQLPRTAVGMAASLPMAGLNELRSGDLLFFNTNGNAYSHVGLYVQGDEFVHASSQKTGKVLVSRLSNPYWRRHLTGARRPFQQLR